MRTNRAELLRGLKLMMITVVLMFAGPSTLYIAFSNKEKPLYIPILIAGLIICSAAIYLGFKGIRTILNSMFDNSNSN